MASPSRPSIEEIERGVIRVVSEQCGWRLEKLHRGLDLVADLHIDSLDIVEIFSEVEAEFDVLLPADHRSSDQFYKQAFRGPFTIGKLAELVHMRWGSGAQSRPPSQAPPLVDLDVAGFAQLGWSAAPPDVGSHAYEHAGAQPSGAELLRRWFLLDGNDRRQRHQSVVQEGALDGAPWRPRRGTEEWPMVLVAWHGARAYARWAHGLDPFDPDGPSHLPTEAQWEFAARGGATTTWPWGDEPPAPGRLRAGRAREAHSTGELPLGPVHALDGAPPFHLRGMLGHVWQWCADTYAVDAYGRREHQSRDPVHEGSGAIRVERGGSWVGPVSLCRPSYRRGRVAHARGRCLGFRCAATLTSPVVPAESVDPATRAGL